MGGQRFPCEPLKWYDCLLGEPDVGTSSGVTGVRRGADAGQILIAVGGLLAGLGVAWIVSHAGGDRFTVPKQPLAVPVIVGVGWSFIGSGLLYWRSRPDNHLWAVLIFQGFAWFGSILPSSN